MSVLSSERWHAASPYLDEALELARHDRQDWLAALRDTQPDLAEDVSVLLEEHDSLIGRKFLEDVVAPERALRSDEAGATFGPYRLTQPLGEGGMGVVWLAQQEHPIRRTVALKVVKPGRGSRDVLSRFESERQALAILNHQHIAKVLDAGVTSDGRPYFAMEHVVGQPITAFADRHALTIRQRLELFLQVCDAVQHAHQKGVLHRDLKPGNILVSEQDGRPLVKVIDFGIAKAIGQHLTGETLNTEFGVLLGTPEYMSPEQAGLLDAAVDTRTDIYSLGLVLYELLVGIPAFDARELRRKTMLEALRIIREDEPARLSARLRGRVASATIDIARARQSEPRSLLRQLRGDLEWITARAINKDPSLRYPSVSELGADVSRHLRSEPVLAGPPSTWYRVRKLAQRHRAGAVALAIVAAAIAVSAVVSTVSLVRTVRAEDRTRRQLIGSLVAQGMQRVDSNDSLTGLVYLTKALELETDPDRIRSHRIRIAETLQRSPRLVDLWRHEGAITMLALSPNGLVATGSADGTIKVRELSTGTSRDIQQGGAIQAGAFSRDGRLLAVVSDAGQVRIWDPGDGSLRHELNLDGNVADVAFSPDVSLVASIDRNGSVRVWDVPSGAIRFTGQHTTQGRRAVFSTSGSILATASEDEILLWHLPTGQPYAKPIRHDARLGLPSLVFSDDDRWLATAGADFTVRLWDARTANQLGESMRHGAGVVGLTFADQSRLLVTGSLDGTTRFWRPPNLAPVGTPLRSASLVAIPDVSRDLIVASPTQGGLVDLWSVNESRAAPSLPHGALALVKFDRSGRFLLTGDGDGLVRVWDLAPAAPAPSQLATDDTDFHWHVVASPDGTVAGVSSGGSPERAAIRVFDVRSGIPRTPTMRFGGYANALAFSPDGRRFVTASVDGTSRLWSVDNGEPLTPLVPDEVPWKFADFSPDGETFVVAGGSDGGTFGAARIRSAKDGTARTELLRHNAPVHGAWFSPDGRLLVTADVGVGEVKTWDVAGRLLWTARQSGGVLIARWTLDGRTILTGGFDQRIRTWTSSSGAAGRVVLKTLGNVSSLNLTRDGSRLITGSDGGDVRIFQFGPNTQTLAVMAHKGFVYQTVFSPDGTLVLTAAGDRTARLWDGQTGEPLTPSLSAVAISRGATFVEGAKSWAWTGMGVFVESLSVDERPVEQLRDLAESTAARALSASGAELALSADEIVARFARTATARNPLPPAPADSLRAKARDSWMRGRFDEVVSNLGPLAAGRALYWLDLMRLLGAYAMTDRWHDALEELRRHHERRPFAPELFYLEAVTLRRLGDTNGVERLCRDALDSTRTTQHPERAYWAARACLLSVAIDAHRQGVAERIGIAYPQMAGNIGRAELEAALLLRSGRSAESFELLQRAVRPESTVRPAVLLAALAAATAGRRADALTWLKRADAIPKPGTYRQLGPWLEVESDILREEVRRALDSRTQ
jgi:eukaryotic-like serine/threonine-protein kinase